MAKIPVGIIGLGFIGPAHIEALLRTGLVEIVAVSDQNREMGKAAAEKWNCFFYEDYKELLKIPSLQAVHVCTPNFLHYPMVKEALLAGKHVVCEKPLATTVSEAIELTALAKERNLKAAVNFNLRFYPLVQEARANIAKGDLGKIHAIHGSYLQDWLLYDTDYNWRLEPSMSGDSRAIADIGSHWMDMIEHVSGKKIVEVMADFSTVHSERKKPKKGIQTFSNVSLKPEEYDTLKINTEDFASVLFHFDDGATGVLTVSQVSAGRKNRLFFEMDGSKKSIAFDSEKPNELWLGERSKANAVLMKDPSLLSEEARAFASYPGGHNEGFPDTFKQMYREFYSTLDKALGSFKPTYASFADGLRELQLCEAIVKSSKSRTWTSI